MAIDIDIPKFASAKSTLPLHKLSWAV